LGCKPASTEPFQGFILTEFFNGALRGIPAEGVAGKRQNGGWDKGQTCPSIIKNTAIYPRFMLMLSIQAF